MMPKSVRFSGQSSKTQQKTTFRPLSSAQENAIDLLITGATDAETAAAVHVHRATMWEWRQNPLFVATLHARRAELWRAPQDKLRSLAMKAAENLASAIEEGNIRASVELLKLVKATGVPDGETDPEAVMAAQVAARLERECPNDVMGEFLIDQARPGWYQRKQAIQAEFWERYGEITSS